MPRIAGSHHPQYIDVVHREHAVIETGGSGPLRPWARGRTRSSPAGSGTAPCLHPSDQPRPSPRRERKHGLRSRSQPSSGFPGTAARPLTGSKQTRGPKPGASTISNYLRSAERLRSGRGIASGRGSWYVQSVSWSLRVLPPCSLSSPTLGGECINAAAPFRASISARQRGTNQVPVY
jgi:hypothetical protein